MAIPVVRTRLLAALALGFAFLSIIGATVFARALTSTASDDFGHGPNVLQQIVQDPALRFGGDQTPLPLTDAPLAISPSVEAPPPASSPYRFIWPNDYPLVQGMWAGHPLGIDIGATEGQPIRSVRDGHVIFAGGDACCNYGLFVIVGHDEGWSSLYAHFSRIDVKYGELVTQGQVLGLSGGTGHVTGPHVHFELRHYGGVVNPLDYLEPHRSWAVTADLLAELREQQRAGGVTSSAPATGRDGASPVSANEPPPPTEPAESAHLDSAGAIALGAASMAHQDQAVYEIEAPSCIAAQSGPNWWVTCDGHIQGCRGAVCDAQLTVCVFDQPRLVTAACP